MVPDEVRIRRYVSHSYVWWMEDSWVVQVDVGIGDEVIGVVAKSEADAIALMEGMRVLLDKHAEVIVEVRF